MSDFNLDKKKEHEQLADEALAAGEFAKSYSHVIEAVRYTAILAERCTGMLRQAYVANGEQLLDVAERIKKMAETAATKRAAKETKAKQTEHAAEGDADGGGEAVKSEARHNTGVRFDDVKGLEEAKAVVRNALINPVKHSDKCKVYKIESGNGLLLYGPPGTGKTMFAKAVAGELGLPFIYKKASDIKDKYVGGSEKNITNLFKEAHSYKQSVVFLDECDDLLRARGNQKVNVVNTFIAEMGGFGETSDSRAFFLLATNKPWLIDDAVFSRIGAAVHIGLPEPITRKFILEAALKDVPLADDVDIDALVALTDGYSGRELADAHVGLCFVAKSRALERWIKRVEANPEATADTANPEPITQADFKDALAGIKPTSKLNPEAVKRNLAWSLEGRSSFGSDDDPED